MATHSRALSVELVTNQNDNTVWHLLEEKLKAANRAQLAVAFTTDAGLDQIYDRLVLVAQRGGVELLTGTYGGVTEPPALAALLDVQRNPAMNLEAKLSSRPKFHWKLYLLHLAGSQVVAIVGSSNLTLEGLSSPGETSVLLRGHRTQPAIAALLNHFDREWKREPGLLSQPQIDDYMAQRGKGPPPPAKMKLAALRKKGDKTGRPPQPSGHWRDWISGSVKSATEHQVANNTNWDKKGWQWFTGSTCDYESGDRVALFDFTAGRITFNVIKEVTTLLKSADGKYAFAYQRDSSVPLRKLTRNLWRRLKADGLLKSKDEAMKLRRMTRGRWVQLRELLKKG